MGRPNTANNSLKQVKTANRSMLLRYEVPSCPPTAYSRSLSTETPTPHRRLLIGATMRHSFDVGSYRSTLEMASPLHQPPTAQDSLFYFQQYHKTTQNMIKINKLDIVTIICTTNCKMNINFEVWIKNKKVK